MFYWVCLWVELSWTMLELILHKHELSRVELGSVWLSSWVELICFWVELIWIELNASCHIPGSTSPSHHNLCRQKMAVRREKLMKCKTALCGRVFWILRFISRPFIYNITFFQSSKFHYSESTSFRESCYHYKKLKRNLQKWLPEENKNQTLFRKRFYLQTTNKVRLLANLCYKIKYIKYIKYKININSKN